MLVNYQKPSALCQDQFILFYLEFCLFLDFIYLVPSRMVEQPSNSQLLVPHLSLAFSSTALYILSRWYSFWIWATNENAIRMWLLFKKVVLCYYCNLSIKWSYTFKHDFFIQSWAHQNSNSFSSKVLWKKREKVVIWGFPAIYCVLIIIAIDRE